MNPYRYVYVRAIPAPMGEVLTAEHEKGVARDVALAEAAPDLLDALRFIVAAYGEDLPSGAIDLARAAIAKARGETL